MIRTSYFYDKTPMESFLHTLGVELVHQWRWAIRDEARRDLFGYIEGYDNEKRVHSVLGNFLLEQAEWTAS